MKTLASILFVTLMIVLFGINIQNRQKAYEKKLHFLIQTTSFWEVTDYTNNYNIDSLGCIHFVNHDSVPVVICGTFIIKPNKIENK